MDIQRAYDLVNRLMKFLVSSIFLVLIITGGLQVFFRFVINRPLIWTEELSRYLFIWLVYISIAAGLERGSHIGIDSLVRKLPPVAKKIVELFTSLAIVVFAVFLISLTTRVIAVSYVQTTPGLGIRMSYVHWAGVVGNVFVLIIAVLKFLEMIVPAKKEETLKW